MFWIDAFAQGISDYTFIIWMHVYEQEEYMHTLLTYIYITADRLMEVNHYENISMYL